MNGGVQFLRIGQPCCERETY